MQVIQRKQKKQKYSQASHLTSIIVNLFEEPSLLLAEQRQTSSLHNDELPFHFTYLNSMPKKMYSSFWEFPIHLWKPWNNPQKTWAENFATIFSLPKFELLPEILSTNKRITRFPTSEP